MAQLRKKIKTHADAVLYALRYTFLTEAGEYTDPFTLQYVARDAITLRRPCATCTHAKRRLRNCLCGSEIWSGRGAESGAVGETLDTDFAKLLNIVNLQTAEVVELADTPSKSPKSRVFSKFRVINQVANKSDTCPPYLINCSYPKTTQGCGDRIQKRTH